MTNDISEESKGWHLAQVQRTPKKHSPLDYDGVQP